MALYFECQINKNALLQFFLAILRTGNTDAYIILTFLGSFRIRFTSVQKNNLFIFLSKEVIRNNGGNTRSKITTKQNPKRKKINALML